MLQEYYLAVSKLERTQFLYEMSFTVNKRKIYQPREAKILGEK
jgi:hypothetical protein